MPEPGVLWWQPAPSDVADIQHNHECGRKKGFVPAVGCCFGLPVGLPLASDALH